MDGHTSKKKTEANYDASKQIYQSANASNYTGNDNWSREEIITSVDGQRVDYKVEGGAINVGADISGWWKFTFEYELQDPKKPKYSWQAKQIINPGLDNVATDKLKDTFKFTTEGTHKIIAISCDKAKNCSAFSEDEYIKIDYTKPTCTLKETFENTDGFNSFKWLGLVNGGLDSNNNRTYTKQMLTLSHNCEDVDYNVSSNCNVESPFNKQSYKYDFNMQSEKAGANGYESKYGTDVRDEGKNSGVYVNDYVKPEAGGHVVDYAGNISETCPVRQVQIDYEPPKCTTEIKYPQGEPINPSISGDISTGWLGLVNGGWNGSGYTTEKKTAHVYNVCTEIPTKSKLTGISSGCDDSTLDKITYDWELNVTNAGAAGVGDGGEIADKAGNRTVCPADKKINADYTRTKCEVKIEYPQGNPVNPTEGNIESGWLGLVSDYSDSKKTARVYQVCTDQQSTSCVGYNCVSSCIGTPLTHTYNYDVNTPKAGPDGPDKDTFTTDKAGNKTSCGYTPENWHTVKADYERPKCEVVSTFIDRRTGKSGNYTGQFLGKNSTVTIQSFCDNAYDPGDGLTSSYTITGARTVSSGCFFEADSSTTYRTEMKVTDATSKGRGASVYVYDRAKNRSANPCEKKPVFIDHTSAHCIVEAKYGDKNSIDSAKGSSVKDYSVSSVMNDFLDTKVNFGTAGWVSGKYGVRVHSYCQDDEISGDRTSDVDKWGSGCAKNGVSMGTCDTSKRNQETCCLLYKNPSPRDRG